MKYIIGTEGDLKKENYNLRQRITKLEDALYKYKLREKKLQENEECYRSIVDNQIEMVGIYRPDTTLTYVNEAQCRYFNKKPEELIGTSFLSLIYEEDQKTVIDKIKYLTIANPIATIEERVITPNGEIRWQEWINRGVFDEKGRLTEIHAIGRDINKRKQAEEKLKKSEEQYRSLFNSMHEGFALLEIICDDSNIPIDYRYLDVNPAFERILGTKRDKLIGKTILELYPDIEEFWIKTYGQVALTGKRKHFRQSYSRFDKYLEIIAYSPGRMQCAVLFIDISEQKEMERQIASLDRLNLVGEIAASIGHEIRNPMTIVRGFLQLLMEKPEFCREREYFNIMIEEIDRSTCIIKEFLSLVKSKQLELKMNNINSIIESIYPLLQADAVAGDKLIKTELKPIPDLMLDEKEIRQLLINLVRNGLEAMSEGGIVTISTYEEDQEIIMAVKDEGKGIEPEIIKKIGIPFFSTKEEGIGLGLPVCFSIAERNNAQIDIETGSDGTTFSVRFKKKQSVNTCTTLPF